jgi:exosortase
MARKKRTRDLSGAPKVPKKAPNKSSSGGGASEAVATPAEVALAPWTLLAAALLGVAFVWSYWPTLGELVAAWNREPDYSHGYLVAPLAMCFLWARRDLFPGFSRGLAWPGLVLLAIALAIRTFAGLIRLDSLDGYSIVLWAAGAVWLLAGPRVLGWSLPSILFLAFMVPIPYRAERVLSLPLQRTAATLSSWVLQLFGVPCFAAGTTIRVANYPLEVEHACSGLRIFVGITALAFAYMILVRPPIWKGVVLLASVLPIALLANAVRIVGTGLCYHWGWAEGARRFGHDTAGLVMIPLAAGMFALVLLYLNKIVFDVEVGDVGWLVRSRPSGAGVQGAARDRAS